MHVLPSLRLLGIVLAARWRGKSSNVVISRSSDSGDLIETP